MRLPFLDRFVASIKKIRQPKPLVPHHQDVTLVRQVHGRIFPQISQLRHIRRILSRGELLALRLSSAALLLGCIWLGFLVAQMYRTTVPAVGGRYAEAVVGAPELVNPIFASVNDVDMDLSRLIYSGLMRYDEKQRLVFDLASAYSVSEDKKVYRFELRKDVVWHDHEPFTAHDVVFTIETIQNPLVNSPLFVSFQGVTVRAEDDYTVVFELKEPFAPFLSVLTVGVIPQHILGDVPAERLRLHKTNIQPIGTGPFIFSRLLKDDVGYVYQYELARNTSYYRSAPYIEQFILYFFAEFDGDTGAIQALREQQVDGLSFVPHDLRDKVERKHISIHTFQLPQYTALFLNQDENSALKDKNTRTALEKGLDKERILREVLRDEGTVIHGPILSGFPGHNPALAATTSYALDEANTLLDGAGWGRISADEYRTLRAEQLRKELEVTIASSTEPGTVTTSSLDAEVEKRLGEELQEAQTVYRKNKDGVVLELRLVTADTPEYKQAAELIAGFWQEIGVKTVIERVVPKDMGRLALRGRRYDVLLYGLLIGSDPDQFAFWHSTQVEFPGLNLSRYINRSADALLEKARETPTVEEAAELYKKFEETLLADRPAIFLYSPTYTYATTDRVQGIIATGIFHPSDRFNSVTQWYVETDGQWSFTRHNSEPATTSP